MGRRLARVDAAGSRGEAGTQLPVWQEEEDNGSFAKSPLDFGHFQGKLKIELKSILFCYFDLFCKPKKALTL
jgi:hypothetical protein